MIVSELESKLVESGFDVKQIVEIDWGVSLRLANGGSCESLYQCKGAAEVSFAGKRM